MDNETLANPSNIENSEKAKLKFKLSNFFKKKNKGIKPTGFKCLGNIVKLIGFLVALAIIAIHVLAAYILFKFRPLYMSVCALIVTVGFIIALIVLFLIYALGHSINQNNEILYLLREKSEK